MAPTVHTKEAPMEALTRVRREARKRAAADQALRAAVREAVAAGTSMREVGRAAGISHTHVRRIIEGGTDA